MTDSVGLAAAVCFSTARRLSALCHPAGVIKNSKPGDEARACPGPAGVDRLGVGVDAIAASPRGTLSSEQLSSPLADAHWASLACRKLHGVAVTVTYAASAACQLAGNYVFGDVVLCESSPGPGGRGIQVTRSSLCSDDGDSRTPLLSGVSAATARLRWRLTFGATTTPATVK
jgi:hypothetical protein